ncbi:NAD(P)/FAD-dependent oxidoreductase [Sphingopyxis indica]|uniref:flavin-containing monooxygenase n=1 Tax=Sphingopyxis indica TaxID=436663 RepID=UPI00293927EB|nr:NAD(P)/FAD-dependent oxidoreductase [Sphingopyxis indica]WOF42514.1 NAD(P)/FAD-dependent oxidoreductase [Sphingopyxis indica]
MAEADLNVACRNLDVLIVGAGLSGVGMAATLRQKNPREDILIVERRSDVGGTWALFRYPGIRSDSDMHTLGFEFEPWREDRAIAGADAILQYMNHTIDKYDLRRKILFGHRVVSADWHGGEARWRVLLEDQAGVRQLVRARFFHLGAGYYDHDEPYDAALPGREAFEGALIHPQFWPEDLDYAGKRVVVIGSGATAVTLVPAMAERAAHVTMLQRTPTWVAILPSRDALANAMRKLMPAKLAYALTRFKNTRFQDWMFRRMRNRPDKARKFLLKRISAQLGTRFRAADFTPPYDPWDQRLCVVPDGDLFAAMKAGKADVVTDHVEQIEADGILLRSGRRLPADIIVTATGLKMVLGGKIAMSVDGRPLDFSQHYFYKSCMLSNVPNMTLSLGYFNASFTLRLSLVADYVSRLLDMMRGVGADIATPTLLPGKEPAAIEPFEMTSGYLQRARGVMPKSASCLPWRLEQDYLTDRRWMKNSPVDDGILTFDRALAGVDLR